MLYGVDVHGGFQAGISFSRLAQQGYSFAAIKATQGLSFVAPQFLDSDKGPGFVTQARQAGLIPGAYHWLDASDGAAQARHFHNLVRQAGGPAGMLIQLDCEDDGYGPQIHAWAAEWARLTGGHPFLIYSGAWWWSKPPMAGVRGVDVTPYLWDSHYLTADLDTIPDDPAAFAARIPESWWAGRYGGWPSVAILQFTSKGDAGGLGNNVDLNATRMTREQLLALTRVSAITGGEEDMETEQTRIHAFNSDAYGHGWAIGADEVQVVGIVDTHPGQVPLGHWGVKTLRALAGDVAELMARPPVQPAPVDAAALAAALAADTAFLDAIAERVAAKVNPTVREVAATFGEAGAAAVRSGSDH